MEIIFNTRGNSISAWLRIFVSHEGPSPEGKSQKAICPSCETKMNSKNKNFYEKISREGLFALRENPSGLGPSREIKAVEIAFPQAINF